jgi:hypothetical protein
MDSIREIRALLQTFQDGYTQRDQKNLDAFMELFLPEAESIGTNGIAPGVDEWYMDSQTARKMISGDWEGWGDFRLDLEKAAIHANGDTGWVAGTATVSTKIGPENYEGFLKFIQNHIMNMPVTPEEKLLNILRGGSNTVYELRRGEQFTWPVRFTAVVVRKPEGWKFAQVHFSFPTIYFPDVRIFPDQQPDTH